MDLVFLQYPLILLSWILSLLTAILIPAAKKYSGILTILSAGAGAVMILLAFFYSIPAEELLLILVITSVIICRAAFGGDSV